MFTPMEEHEMHAPKRYLHFVEDSRVRVFTCAGASGCPAANWAVLKAGQGQDAAAALAFAQAQFAQAGALPLVVWAPDALPLSACEAVLSESGYTLRKVPVREFCTGAEESLELHANDCPVVLSASPMQGAQGQLLAESCEGLPGRAELLKRQLRAGARAYFACNRAEIPVSVCLGFGYASTLRLFGLYTAKSQRGKGYGMAVLRAAARWAQAPGQGYEPFALAPQENGPAVRLLQRAGFLGRPQQRWYAVQGNGPVLQQIETLWL